MLEKDLKKPYTFSLSSSVIRDIQYYKKTIPDQKLDKQVEDFIASVVPSRTCQQ